MRGFRNRASAVATAAIAIIALAPGVALAAWSGTGAGSAAGAAATMPTGSQPTAVDAGSSVDLRWTSVTLPSGASVQGYTISRVDTNGDVTPASGTCAGVVVTVSCTDSSVPSGTCSYSDTPVLQSWTGGASPLSASVVVP